ncbi:MAG: MOSC domain-containing protein [Dyadobacter sp. 50-39]|uniref:MOSC domain-containing protein n=1 Tax=Dyadobacter sp. 50-39 TaxID=1895756 RepID=UPI0009691BEC|nr:MOSC N-terminal beta barrel domain-containing protein [Dyadobacter sp. 50-39]OJV20514.1 MAG: MOSC domain-containing protein [Dyadobacter sp. 50-39]
MDSAYLSEIWIYPVKSLAGFRVREAYAGWAGLRHDRQWMLIDAFGRFLTQRILPQMARLQARIVPEGLLLASIDELEDSILIPLSHPEGPLLTVKVWDDLAMAHMPSAAANRWLSDKLGREISIVGMRQAVVSRTYDGHDRTPRALSFADDFPYHLVGQSSVDALNISLEEKIDIRRFRPNLIISGCGPFEEDFIETFKIGGARFAAISPCERCLMVNVDPESGRAGKQPLKALARTRRQGNKIIFGQNVIPLQEGIIAEGDTLLF